MTATPATEELFRNYGILCKEAADKLSASKKLKSGWLMTSGLFPNDVTPTGDGIQFFRSNWFNEEGKGIHFETWTNKNVHEKKLLPFVLHIEAGKSRAGFGQKDFQKLFLEQCGAGLETHGYKLNQGYAMEPIKCFRTFTPDSFVDVVVAEFLLLSKYGKDIDSIIKELKTG